MALAYPVPKVFGSCSRGLKYKLFTCVFLQFHNKLECLPLSFTSTLVEYLQARLLELIRVESLTRLNSNGWPLALPTNIRLGWK
jgi:hypothetical protein